MGAHTRGVITLMPPIVLLTVAASWCTLSGYWHMGLECSRFAVCPWVHQ
jgi:hypothetical protein